MDGAEILALSDHTIDRVTFYKRDELTTDLICCEICCGDTVYLAHEEEPIWDALISKLAHLPGFASDWIEKVSQPCFERSETIAFDRFST